MQLWWVVAVLVASALAAEDSVVATGAAAAAASHSSAADVVFTQAAVDAAIQQSVDATKKALTKKMEQEKQERARDSAERLATITKEATDKRQKLQERITATEEELSSARKDLLEMRSKFEKLKSEFAPKQDDTAAPHVKNAFSLLATHEKHEKIRNQLDMKVDELQATKLLAGQGADSNGQMAAKLQVHHSAKEAAVAEATSMAKKSVGFELQKSAVKEAMLKAQADQLNAELKKKKAEAQYWLQQQMQSTADLKTAISNKKAAAAGRKLVTVQAYTSLYTDVEVQQLERELKVQVSVLDSRKAALAASNCSDSAAQLTAQ